MYLEHVWVLSEFLPFAAGQSQAAPHQAPRIVISQ